MKPVHTHYDNLKVARDAPPEVIRAAYKTLCHKFHPDRHGGSAKATQAFQMINTAYEVLSDPERRRKHDAWILRAEHGSSKAAVPADSSTSPWNGRERRRTSPPNHLRPPGGSRIAPSGVSAGASPPGTRSSRGTIEAGLRLSGLVAVLWAAVAMAGAMLVLLY